LSSLNKSSNNLLGRITLDFKGVNQLLLLGFFAIFFSIPSIRAQISNLYDQQNDQVAGINNLMSAVASNDVDGVKFFSKAGMALVNQKNLGGATVLHIASREKNLQIATILIESGADVNATDNEGWTPLMRASLSGDVAIVNLLLSKDAKANTVNSIGESALIHATTSDCNDCLDVMFEKFNFIKLMDERLLKEQLTDAFVIAKNRENQRAQNLIEAYLDKVIKMSPLLERAEPEAPQQSSQSDATTSSVQEKNKPNGKIFRIVSPDGIISKPSMLSKQGDERTLLQTPDEAPTKIIVEDISAPVVSAKKFKFISGPESILTSQTSAKNSPAKDALKEVPQKKNYKFTIGNEGKSLKAKTLSLGNEQSDEKNGKEVIMLIEKSPNSKPETNVKKSGNLVFKFHKGEDGAESKTTKTKSSKAKQKSDVEPFKPLDEIEKSASDDLQTSS
jgi:hypothetical protein